MTNDQLNQFGMFRRVNSTLTEKAAVITSIPSLNEQATLFAENLADIKATAIKYNDAAKGKTKLKHNAIDEMVDEVIPLKAVLKSYAKQNNDEVLLAKVSVSPSVLRAGLRDEERTNILEDIIAEAESHPEVMANSSITPEMVAAVRAKYDALMNAAAEQDTGFNSRKALRISLGEKIRNENELLRNHLDELIELIKKSDKQTYDQYFAARVILDYGGKISIEEDAPAENTEQPA